MFCELRARLNPYSGLLHLVVNPMSWEDKVGPVLSASHSLFHLTLNFRFSPHGILASPVP